MLKNQTETIISVIGGQFFQPIADLLEKLINRPYQKQSKISSNYYEGGYSASIILLMGACMESLVQRDRHFRQAITAVPKKTSAVSDYSKICLHYRRHKHLEEFFDVRNAIAHNHLWEMEFISTISDGNQHKRSTILPGTHKLREVPLSTTRIPKTKRIRLNLNPVRLDRTDVIKSLTTFLHFLAHLSKRGQKPIDLIKHSIAFNGKRLLFPELLSKLEGSV